MQQIRCNAKTSPSHCKLLGSWHRVCTTTILHLKVLGLSQVRDSWFLHISLINVLGRRPTAQHQSGLVTLPTVALQRRCITDYCPYTHIRTNMDMYQCMVEYFHHIHPGALWIPFMCNFVLKTEEPGSCEIASSVEPLSRLASSTGNVCLGSKWLWSGTSSARWKTAKFSEELRGGDDVWQRPSAISATIVLPPSPNQRQVSQGYWIKNIHSIDSLDIWPRFRFAFWHIRILPAFQRDRARKLACKMCCLRPALIALALHVPQLKLRKRDWSK